MSSLSCQGVGIDACRGGWCAVALGPAGWQRFALFARISEVWKTFADADIFLIDIPIGLSEDGSRECDALARRMLGRRGVSVFTPPCRAALVERTYREASAANFRHTGRRLSIQCYNIMSKIAEADRFLRRTPAARGRLRESHPEVCFAALAARPMDRPKKGSEGFAQRLAVLQPFIPEAGDIVKKALDRYPRSILARDDIADALVLALSAAMPPERLASLPALPLRDAHGLPMEIVYTFFALPKIGRAKKMLPSATACRLPNVGSFLWERLSSRDIEAGSLSHRKTISLPHGMAACSLNHPHPASPVKGGGKVNVEKMQMPVPSPCGRCQGHQR